MAEATAVIGLVASIASLIDLGAKVASRLHEIVSKTSDVPESFRALSTQLPLLTSSVQFIAHQAQAGHLSDDVVRALQSLITSTSTQVSVIQTCLSQILPPTDATKAQRAAKALKSPAKVNDIRRAVDKVHHNINFLVLHQTTQHVDTGERILEALTNLQLAHSQSSAGQRGHHIASVSAYDQAFVHLGDVYNFGHAQEPNMLKPFGLCLGSAPRIEPDAFKGRREELRQLQDSLLPTNHPRQSCIVSIVGLGGMGKTQLSLTHARECAQEYSSIFWINAKDATSLRRDFAALNAIIFPDTGDVATYSADDENLAIDRVRRWLSQRGNDQWLLIFDNYDDPQLPGIRSSTGYDIRPFFPARSQGSILITTRSTKLTFSKQVHLKRLEDVRTSVAILSQRSGRDLSDHDNDAATLATRLGGLPLALATAGTYLASANISCCEYLDLYQNMWSELFGTDAEELLEYEERTLSSTWNISLNHVRSQHPDAAELLSFFAFLSPRDIWYELLKAGASDDVPWLRRVTSSPVQFQRAMTKLHDYSLVDVVGGSFQVHPCLHDWLLESLPTPPTLVLFMSALSCVAESISDSSEAQYWAYDRRLFDHVAQLESKRFLQLWITCSSDEKVFTAAQAIASLESKFDRYSHAALMYQRALAGNEKALGPDHTSTLDTVGNLGSLYRSQGKLDEAKQMYQRALAGYEKALGPDHTSCLETVNNLGNLYANQGKLSEAEQMYQRALAGKEKALGTHHTSTLDTVNNLGNLYANQGKLSEAEQMYQRALAGYEKALGPDHTSTLDTVNNLGLLYANQGKLADAEQIYQRALAGYEKALGPDHTSTLKTVNNLGNLYADQGKMDEAEQMYQRALAGYEKALGPDHTSTLDTVNNLGVLYANQGKLADAEQMYQRALAGYEKALGPDHTWNLSTVNNLGLLYANQGKRSEAEQMYQRALAGFEKALGPDHTLTLDTINNLGLLYADQGKPGEAKQMYQRALAGFEKALGPDHTSTLSTVNNLGLLYANQGKLADAEQMYQRALDGFNKRLGQKHIRTRTAFSNLTDIRTQRGKVDDIT